MPSCVGAGGAPAPDGQLAPFDFAEAGHPTLPARVALCLYIDVVGNRSQSGLLSLVCIAGALI